MTKTILSVTGYSWGNKLEWSYASACKWLVPCLTWEFVRCNKQKWFKRGSQVTDKLLFT